jgi:glycine hydroxymethyltransferase
MHVIAGKAVAFKEALSPEFKEYQQQVVKNAKALAEDADRTRPAHRVGPYRVARDAGRPAFEGLTGKEAEAILGQAHMTCNKNGIPNDPQKPFVTSGIRLGSPAFTTRGFKEEDATKVGNLIADVLDNPHDAATIERVKAKSRKLTDKYPGLRSVIASPTQAAPATMKCPSVSMKTPMKCPRYPRIRGGRRHPPPAPLRPVRQALHDL